MPAPFCFILIPFSKKKDATGREVDFDAVYNQLIAPAVRDAGLEPLRADEEKAGGVIHTPIFEQLVLCEYAVVDLTAATANVFYEIGVRDSVKPGTTLLLFAEGGGQDTFDAAQFRAICYGIGPDGRPTDDGRSRSLLTERLKEARNGMAESSLFQLVDSYPKVNHTKTDVFRTTVDYSKTMREKLAQARKAGLDAVRHVESEVGSIADCETGVVIDLFLSYRAVEGWDEMIALVPKMSSIVAATVMVREQLGLALNRAGRGEEAERVLLELIVQRGASSETYGILGRVYKDRWDDARKAGETMKARGLLDTAIETYLKGFEADWRDAYPGVNAVTLMELKAPPDPRRFEIMPVVTYAVKRRIACGTPDYWDFATLLELAVLAKDEAGASENLSRALAAVRETWEPETTARNLRLIRQAREERGEANPVWVRQAEGELERKAGNL